MRDGFNENEARIEFTRQNIMLRHYESREASNQLIHQETHGQNEGLEMRIGMMNHEFQSAMQMAKMEFESEFKVGGVRNEEVMYRAEIFRCRC